MRLRPTVTRTLGRSLPRYISIQKKLISRTATQQDLLTENKVETCVRPTTGLSSHPLA
jgi:hypothetical protein